MGDLLEAALAPACLRAALAVVVANDQADGVDSASVRRLVDAGDAALTALATEVAAGTFRPRPLTAVTIPKSGGGVRHLSLPVARERVIERAVLSVLVGPLDELLGPTSYGFRSGLGVGDAVRRVVELREEGFAWVVHGDIDECFPSIPRDRLARLLDVVVPDTGLRALLGLLLGRPVQGAGNGLRVSPGLAQGSPLSPLLANLYLAQFDERMRAAGYPLVRFADDFVVLATDRNEAERALEVAMDAVQRIGLSLDVAKTEVLDFRTGFCFLGEDINHRYPPTPIGNEQVADPGRRTVYIGTQGAYVSMRAGRLLVSRDDAELLSAPSSHVGRLVLFGSVTMSSGARAWALQDDVDVVFASRRGGLMGWLASASSGPTAMRRRQFQVTTDPGLCRAVGVAMLEGKLNNQRVLLQRYLSPVNVDIVGEAVNQIGSYRELLRSATTTAELMGTEGIAARAYFAGLAGLVPGSLGFHGRSRRPPTDVVNAALSYGYTILVGDAVTACAAAGLDPAVGFLHADHERRPSLALDLAEEFRPTVVDAAVLALVRRGDLTVEHGRPMEADRGVLLTEEGRRRLTASVERRMLQLVYHVPINRKTSMRRVMFHQAQALASVVRSGDPTYRAFLRRV